MYIYAHVCIYIYTLSCVYTCVYIAPQAACPNVCLSRALWDQSSDNECVLVTHPGVPLDRFKEDREAPHPQRRLESCISQVYRTNRTPSEKKACAFSVARMYTLP